MHRSVTSRSEESLAIDIARTTVLVRGVGDIGSATAHALHSAGYAVVIHNEPQPATIRRGMAFADAVFEGEAMLDGVMARHLQSVVGLDAALAARSFLPVLTVPFEQLFIVSWKVLVDARMRKRTVPEEQRGIASLTIGLGPNFVAGGNVDLAIETHWDRLGAVVRAGPTLPLSGEPRAIAGIGRERFVYAPGGGIFRTRAAIGERVERETVLATIGEVPLAAPIGGMIRGLARDGVPVTSGTKVIEIDPRGDQAVVIGIGGRPRRLAAAVAKIVQEWVAATPRDT